jgi:KUP system potassium uptake protein
MSGKSKLTRLTLGALGVVFGDIGTSPLYALNEIFSSEHHLSPSPENVLGCLSLVFWALTIVVALKYVLFVLQADNDGEGGVFALYGLLHQRRSHRKLFGLQGVLWLLILAAGLLFGDGVITPSISVLSAVEGLQAVTPLFAPYVVPVTLLVLSFLFAIQSRGTAVVGAAFGPVILCWFAAIAFFGAHALFQRPETIFALDPRYALHFLLTSPFSMILKAMGGVVLTVTGGEALYADMGHFGRAPIRLSWFLVVFPALILNYLGQGAFLLSGGPLQGGSLFFSLVPGALLLPMVVLATLATIIASQALISGAFSLSAQAIALGLFPRLEIVHTHHEHEGQIYSPFVNWMLYFGCVLLVLKFGSSTALASAYGLAVAGVMLATSIAMVGVARYFWAWTRARAAMVFGGFALFDLLFVISNSLKFLEGGYIPMLVGVLIFLVMVSWRWGRRATFAAYSGIRTMKVSELVALKEMATASAERNAVLMVPKAFSSLEENTPPLLQLLWARHGTLPRNLFFVEVVHRKVPYVHGNRCEVRVLHRDSGNGAIVSVTIQFGFMEAPDVEKALETLARHHEIDLDPSPEKWVVHVSQEKLLKGKSQQLPFRLRFRIFQLLRQISTPGFYYYGLGEKVQLSIEILPVRL